MNNNQNYNYQNNNSQNNNYGNSNNDHYNNINNNNNENNYNNNAFNNYSFNYGMNNNNMYNMQQMDNMRRSYALQKRKLSIDNNNNNNCSIKKPMMPRINSSLKINIYFDNNQGDSILIHVFKNSTVKSLFNEYYKRTNIDVHSSDVNIQYNGEIINPDSEEIVSKKFKEGCRIMVINTKGTIGALV